MKVRRLSFTISTMVVLSFAALLCPAAKQQKRSQSESTVVVTEVDSTAKPFIVTEPIDQSTMTDEDWLNLRRWLPDPLTVGEARHLFPNLGELRMEWGSPYDSVKGHFLAHLPIEIFGHSAEIIFHFRGNIPALGEMTSTFFEMRNIDSTTAEEVFKKVKEHFITQYGKCQDEEENREFFHEACYWKLDSGTKAVVKNIYAHDRAYVGW